MALGKPLEEYSSAELDDLLKLMGVRQHILSRGHVDGYRLVRLTNAQLTGFPFTPMERWKLQMIRRAYTVFKIFTRGLGSGGSCPVNVIARMLRQSFKYDAAVVEDVKQGLLSHTVGMRAATGERVVTFDQWAQLFHWIGSRLDIHDAEKLQKRMGAHIGCKELDECRAPLQAVNRTDNDTPCMPLHQPVSTGPSFNLMQELFQAITQSTASTQSSEACSLQEEASLNSQDESPITYPLSSSPQSLRMRASASPAPALVSLPVTNWMPIQSAPVQLRMLAFGEMVGGAAASTSSAQSQVTTTAAAAVSSSRGRFPLSSFFPLHSATRGPETSAAAPGDRARDYSIGGSSQRGEGARTTRERSRSQQRAARQIQIPGSVSALGRLMRSQTRTVRATHNDGTQHHPQAHLPVVLSFVQTRGLPVGTRLADGMVASPDDGGPSQIHPRPLSSGT